MARVRSLSGVERVWLAADRVAPPFAIAFVFEGDGEVPAPELERVLPALALAAPGFRGRLRGWLGWTSWHDDGPLPTVTPVTEWPTSGAHPALATPLDPYRGPSAELLTGPGRVVLRIHHAATDGSGGLLLAQRLFAALRGEEPVPTPAGPTVDSDLALGLPVQPEAAVPEDCAAPTGAAASPALSTVWTRRRVHGPVDRPLARAATWIGAAASKHGDTVRIDVPVDLRRHTEHTQTTANLTGLVRLVPERAYTRTARALRTLIAAHMEGAFVLAQRPLRWFPLALMAWAGRRGALAAQQRGTYVASATVSNLGKRDPELFSCPGFRCERIAVIPPGQPGLPLLLTMTGDPHGLELVGAMPASLASDGRLDELMDGLAAHLSPKP